MEGKSPVENLLPWPLKKKKSHILGQLQVCPPVICAQPLLSMAVTDF